MIHVLRLLMIKNKSQKYIYSDQYLPYYDETCCNKNEKQELITT